MPTPSLVISCGAVSSVSVNFGHGAKRQLAERAIKAAFAISIAGRAPLGAAPSAYPFSLSLRRRAWLMASSSSRSPRKSTARCFGPEYTLLELSAAEARIAQEGKLNEDTLPRPPWPGLRRILLSESVADSADQRRITVSRALRRALSARPKGAPTSALYYVETETSGLLMTAATPLQNTTMTLVLAVPVKEILVRLVPELAPLCGALVRPGVAWPGSCSRPFSSKRRAPRSPKPHAPAAKPSSPSPPRARVSAPGATISRASTGLVGEFLGFARPAVTATTP